MDYAGPSMISPGALQILDCLTATCVEEPPRNDPPATPSDGASYIIGAAPTGIWAGKAGEVATMTAGGWRYIAPVAGMSAFVRTNGQHAEYDGSWDIGLIRAARVEIDGELVLSTQSAAIASPSGGATVDGEARAQINQVLSALRHHGLIAT